MKLCFDFAFLQSPEDFPNDPGIQQAHHCIRTFYRQMLTTVAEGMVRSNENSDIDYITVYLDDKEFDTIKPELVADSRYIEVRILGYDTERNMIDQIENGASTEDLDNKRFIQLMLIDEENIIQLVYTDMHHLQADVREMSETHQLPVKYHPTVVHYLLHYNETRTVPENKE